MIARVVSFAVVLVGLFVLVVCLAFALASNASPASALSQPQPGVSSSGCDPDWTVVDSPNVSALTGTQLTSVAAVSANDIWAVGYFLSGSTFQTFIIRWNGTAWDIVPSPNVGTSTNLLSKVVAVSANDVWAVGYYFEYDQGRQITLIMHWDGTQWNIVPSPSPGPGQDNLSDVAAISGTDLWTVGSSYGSPIILHYSDPCAAPQLP